MRPGRRVRAAGCCVSCFARRRIPRHLHIFATEVWWRRGPSCYITAVLGNSYLIRVRRRPSLSTGSPRPSVLLASNDFSFGMAHARRSANPVEEKSDPAATPPPPTTRADGKQRLQMRNKITLPRILPPSITTGAMEPRARPSPMIAPQGNCPAQNGYARLRHASLTRLRQHLGEPRRHHADRSKPT